MKLTESQWTIFQLEREPIVRAEDPTSLTESVILHLDAVTFIDLWDRPIRAGTELLGE